MVLSGVILLYINTMIQYRMLLINICITIIRSNSILCISTHVTISYVHTRTSDADRVNSRRSIRREPLEDSPQLGISAHKCTKTKCVYILGKKRRPLRLVSVQMTVSNSSSHHPPSQQYGIHLYTMIRCGKERHHYP